MKKQIINITLIICIALLVTLGNALTSLKVATAGEPSPTQRLGISANEIQSVDLGPEISGMQGRHLRLRRVTLEPSGHNAIHSHADRPEVLYVLEGKIIEHRNGVVIEHLAGSSLFGNREVNHWIENKETTPAVVLVVDIVKVKR